MSRREAGAGEVARWQARGTVRAREVGSDECEKWRGRQRGADERGMLRQARIRQAMRVAARKGTRVMSPASYMRAQLMQRYRRRAGKVRQHRRCRTLYARAGVVCAGSPEPSRPTPVYRPRPAVDRLNAQPPPSPRAASAAHRNGRSCSCRHYNRSYEVNQRLRHRMDGPNQRRNASQRYRCCDACAAVCLALRWCVAVAGIVWGGGGGAKWGGACMPGVPAAPALPALASRTIH